MKNNWSKTLLYVYKYLDRVCDGIDNLIEQSALNSYFYNQSRSENNVLSVAQRICDLSERKVKLINVKVLIDNCLMKSEKLNAQILIEKYIDDDKAENISCRHNLSLRSYYRKLSQAETLFSKFIEREGFSEEKLKEYFTGERWIMEIFEKFENEENKKSC